MSDQSRRFTDREVALVLERAATIDEAEATAAAPGTGLSLDDLTQIAREVGISPQAIERAVASLDRGRQAGSRLAGAPAVRKAVHAVPGELDQEGIARLIGIVDERVDTTGSVSEALGSVRWTGSDRFRSTRVSITPANGKTGIEVVEKAQPRLRRIFQLIPAAWGTMLAGPIVGSLQLPVAGSLVIVAGCALAGIGIGRGVWSLLSASSGRRVRDLAASLADEVHRTTRAGQVPGGTAGPPRNALPGESEPG